MLTMQGGDSLVGGLPIIHITYQQYIANPSAYQDPDVIVHITGFPTAGNMPADYVGYDSNLNMEDIGNIVTKAIAKVEPRDTALYLHPVGSYFINKDGNACVTDVQISVGGAITLGTNCHVVDGVANDINSNLGTISSNLGNISNIDVKYPNRNNVVNVLNTIAEWISLRSDGIYMSLNNNSTAIISVNGSNNLIIQIYVAGTLQRTITL